MYRLTHVVCGIGLGLLLSRDPATSILLGMISGISSYIPDFDLRFKHRKSLHNIFAPIIFSLIVYYVLQFFSGSLEMSFHDYLIRKKIVLAFFMGWFTHIVMDSLTKRGVYLLYPIANKSYGYRIFRSSSILVNLFFIFLSMILYYIWLDRIGFSRVLYVLKTILT